MNNQNRNEAVSIPITVRTNKFSWWKNNHLLVLCVSPLTYIHRHFDIVLFLYLLSWKNRLKAVLMIINRELFVLYLFGNLTRGFLLFTMVLAISMLFVRYRLEIVPRRLLSNNVLVVSSYVKDRLQSTKRRVQSP